MSDTEKNADYIIEEAMKDIYGGIKDSSDTDAGAGGHDDDIEFIEIDLDEEFTDSENEYFSRRGGSEDDTEEEHHEQEDSEDEFDEDEYEDSEYEDEYVDSDGDSEYDDEYDDEDDEDIEDNSDEPDDGEEESEEEKRERRRKGRKIAAIASGSIVGVIAAVYAGFAVYFGSHFMFHTTINGTDFSMKDVAQVEAYMEEQVKGYVLTIEKSDGSEEQIAGKDISLKYVPGKELEKLVKEQNNFFWIETLWKKQEIEASVGVEYDKEMLEAKLAGLQCMVPENQVASVDAHPEFKDTEFVVIPEVIGTQIDVEKLHKEAEKAVGGFYPVLNLAETECYLKPRFLEDSEQVIAAKDAMNSYLGANITYDFHPYTEVVDAAVISQWVTVDGEMNVAFNQDAVRGYIAALAEKYDTIGKTREFTTANGNVVSVNPGTYGWEIDQETEYGALTANIQNAETVTREPAYFSAAATHEPMDMGNTYAEVDLSSQHMWLFQGGQVVLDSDVVTGNPNIWNRETPSGVYSILELQQNKTLVGEIDPKTGKPEYETPVSFWMRVTWSGIGFHDATWQPYFGGSLYLSNGSHGCINMPYGQAQVLYSMLTIGTPVVIHY
ncbi:MAG: L,D-transpeptidase/peptidoglycan binding protein [Lachnospiraceae bacterium]